MLKTKQGQCFDNVWGELVVWDCDECHLAMPPRKAGDFLQVWGV